MSYPYNDVPSNTNLLHCITNESEGWIKLAIEDVNRNPISEWIQCSPAEGDSIMDRAVDVYGVGKKKYLVPAKGGGKDFCFAIVNEDLLRSRMYPTTNPYADATIGDSTNR